MYEKYIIISIIIVWQKKRYTIIWVFIGWKRNFHFECWVMAHGICKLSAKNLLKKLVREYSSISDGASDW